MEKRQNAGNVVVKPLTVENIDVDVGYFSTQRGVIVRGVTGRGEVVYNKEVFQRGAYLPFRPFYERRVERASKRARKALGVLATSN